MLLLMLMKVARGCLVCNEILPSSLVIDCCIVRLLQCQALHFPLPSTLGFLLSSIVRREGQLYIFSLNIMYPTCVSSNLSFVSLFNGKKREGQEHFLVSMKKLPLLLPY